MLFLSLLLSLLGKLISRKPLWHNELQTHHPSEKCLNPSKKCLFPSEKCLADESIQEDHQGLFRGGLILPTDSVYRLFEAILRIPVPVLSSSPRWLSSA